MSQAILVDSKNLIFRVHYTHRTLTSKEGKPTSVLYGVLNNVLGIAKRLPGANWAFVWDGAGPTWRHELLAKDLVQPESAPVRESVLRTASGDKVKGPIRTDWLQEQVSNSLRFIGGAGKGGTRTTTPAPKMATDPVSSPRIGGLKGRPQGYKAHRENLHNSDEHQIALAQIPELKMALKNLGFRQFEVPRLECDDLIGILKEKLRKEFDEVIIYSGDKDFYQFIDHDVRQLKGLLEGKLRWAEQSEIEMEFGIPVSDWVKLKALIGDPSDNIPHLFDKVGPVTAAGWIMNGLDPSLEKFEEHSPALQQKFSILTVRKNEIYLQARWPEVYRNYRLSKIITSVVAPEVQYCASDLVRECSGLSRVRMMRQPMENCSRWFSQWMIGLDMAELWGRRAEFTSIP